MRKVLLIVIGLISFGALIGVQQASAAAVCRTVCDQSAVHNGKPRCFSSHQECTTPKVGSAKPVQKNKKMN